MSSRAVSVLDQEREAAPIGHQLSFARSETLGITVERHENEAIGDVTDRLAPPTAYCLRFLPPEGRFSETVWKLVDRNRLEGS